MEFKRENWSVDSDTGVDDTFAIMLMLANMKKINLLGITCVNGNAKLNDVEQNVKYDEDRFGSLVIKNTITLLEILNQEVDVYIGCDEPLLAEKVKLSNNFGEDAWGDVEEYRLIKGYLHCVKDEHASLAMIRMANQYKGAYNILAIGPLTNIALATRLDPEFASKVNKLVVMGGAHWGMGNVNCNGEHNVFIDPEAFQIVVEEFGEKMELVTWEATYGHEFTEDECQILFDTSTKVGFFLDKLTDRMRKRTGYFASMSDLVAASVALDPSIAKQSLITHCDMEKYSPDARGQLLLLWPHNYYFRKIRREELAKLKKIKVIMEVDSEKVRRTFLECLEYFEKKQTNPDLNNRLNQSAN